MAQMSTYAVFALAFGCATIIFAMAFLVLHVLKKNSDSSRVNAIKNSTQTRYRFLALLSFILVIATSCINFTAELAKTPRYLAGFFVNLFTQTGLVCYIWIVLHRFDRLTSSKPPRYWTTRSARILTVILAVCAAVGYFLRFLFSIAFPKLEGKSRLDLSDYPHYVGIAFTALCSLEIVVVEVFTNIQLLKEALNYTHMESKGNIGSFQTMIRRTLYLWLTLSLGSDFIMISLFVMASISTILPPYETVCVSSSWLTVHVIIAFKFLDAVKKGIQTAKEHMFMSPASKLNSHYPVSAGLEYVSRTDMVKDGLISGTLSQSLHTDTNLDTDDSMKLSQTTPAITFQP